MKKTPEISMTTKYLCQEKQKFERFMWRNQINQIVGWVVVTDANIEETSTEMVVWPKVYLVRENQNMKFSLYWRQRYVLFTLLHIWYKAT